MQRGNGGEDHLTRAMALATRSCWRSCSVEEATSSVFLRSATGRLAYGWARQGRERRTLCGDGLSDPEGEPRKQSEQRQASQK